jgi:diguanylate cyclase (GGDEF)-like protein
LQNLDDILANFAGCEFALIMQETQQTEIIKISERLRKSVIRLKLPKKNFPDLKLSISLGIADFEKGMDKKAISALWKEVKLSEIQKLVSELS